MSMLDLILAQVDKISDSITKQEFGQLIHSDDEAEVERALKAMEDAGGYDNLED